MCMCIYTPASQVPLAVKNLPANAGDIREEGSIPGSGRSPGGGHGNPFQYSCWENPMDRGVQQGHKESNTTEVIVQGHMCILILICL